MMLTCAKCGRKQPLTEDDVANFYPRFFCLSCGQKLTFDVPETKVQELRHSNDPSRRLQSDDLKALAPVTDLRKVAKGAVDLESNG